MTKTEKHAEAIALTGCPHCHAFPTRPCTTRYGEPGTVHKARLEAVPMAKAIAATK